MIIIMIMIMIMIMIIIIIIIIIIVIVMIMIMIIIETYIIELIQESVVIVIAKEDFFRRLTHLLVLHRSRSQDHAG